MRLDRKLIQNLTYENYCSVFKQLIDTKTDRYTNEVKIPMGVDGINYANIQKNIQQISKSFCNRAIKGKYLFSPFREIEIPKAPYTKYEFEKAKRNKKIRTLSICTINDTIFQKMIYDAIYDYTEKKCKHLDDVIYGYRKNKSVKMAVNKIQEYFSQGYLYGIDGDIEKYFDKINHDKLIKKINRFYKQDPLIQKYLYRFLKVRRVPVGSKKNVREYYNKKPITVPRIEGIPQGGVLSGLLANLYLYNFDTYIVNNLMSKYDIKYVRYADDFVILCKDKNLIMDIYLKLKKYLSGREKLKLHDIDTSLIDHTQPNDNKTKAINLNSKYYIEFLGFKISPNYIGIKKSNIKKFKKNISHIIENAHKNNSWTSEVIKKINAKILGNAIFSDKLFSICQICNKPQRPQSWIAFFSTITDMRQLKELDSWIRKELQKYSKIETGQYINDNLLKAYKFKSANGKFYSSNILVSIFRISIEIKEYFNKNQNIEFCKCIDFTTEYLGY